MHLKYCNLTISYQGRLLLMTSEDECSTCARYTLVPARSAPCVLTHFFTIFEILITYTSVPHHELEASQRVNYTMIDTNSTSNPDNTGGLCSWLYLLVYLYYFTLEYQVWFNDRRSILGLNQHPHTRGQTD